MIDEPISRQTGVRLTIGAVISIASFAIYVDRRFGDTEDLNAAQQTYIEVTRRRQDTYIERRDQQHEEVREELGEIHNRLDALCRSLAARNGEDLCR